MKKNIITPFLFLGLIHTSSFSYAVQTFMLESSLIFTEEKANKIEDGLISYIKKNLSPVSRFFKSMISSKEIVCSTEEKLKKNLEEAKSEGKGLILVKNEEGRLVGFRSYTKDEVEKIDINLADLCGYSIEFYNENVFKNNIINVSSEENKNIHKSIQVFKVPEGLYEKYRVFSPPKRDQFYYNESFSWEYPTRENLLKLPCRDNNILKFIVSPIQPLQKILNLENVSLKQLSIPYGFDLSRLKTNKMSIEKIVVEDTDHGSFYGDREWEEVLRNKFLSTSVEMPDKFSEAISKGVKEKYIPEEDIPFLIKKIYHSIAPGILLRKKECGHMYFSSFSWGDQSMDSFVEEVRSLQKKDDWKEIKIYNMDVDDFSKISTLPGFILKHDNHHRSITFYNEKEVQNLEEVVCFDGNIKSCEFLNIKSFFKSKNSLEKHFFFSQSEKFYYLSELIPYNGPKRMGANPIGLKLDQERVVYEFNDYNDSWRKLSSIEFDAEKNESGLILTSQIWDIDYEMYSMNRAKDIKERNFSSKNFFYCYFFNAKYFENLTMLNLSHNNLSEFTVPLGLNLLHLDVSHNDLKEINGLENQKYLKSLNLSNNNLVSKIELHQDSDLEVLDLSNNKLNVQKLEYIIENTLKDGSKLKKMNLSSNQFEFFNICYCIAQNECVFDLKNNPNLYQISIPYGFNLWSLLQTNACSLLELTVQTKKALIECPFYGDRKWEEGVLDKGSRYGTYSLKYSEHMQIKNRLSNGERIVNQIIKKEDLPFFIKKMKYINWNDPAPFKVIAILSKKDSDEIYCTMSDQDISEGITENSFVPEASVVKILAQKTLSLSPNSFQKKFESFGFSLLDDKQGDKYFPIFGSNESGEIKIDEDLSSLVFHRKSAEKFIDQEEGDQAVRLIP